MLNLQLDSNFYHSLPTKTFPKNTACKFWDERKCSWRSCHIFPTTVQIKGHLDKSKLVRIFLRVNPALSKEFLHQSPTSVIVVHSRQWWCTLQWAKPTRAKGRSTLQRGETTIGFGSLEKEMIMRTTQIKGFVLNKKMNFFSTTVSCFSITCVFHQPLFFALSTRKMDTNFRTNKRGARFINSQTSETMTGPPWVACQFAGQSNVII